MQIRSISLVVSDFWTPVLVVLSRQLRNVGFVWKSLENFICRSEFKAFQYNEESASTISPRPLIHRGFGKHLVGKEKRGRQGMNEQVIERMRKVANE